MFGNIFMRLFGVWFSRTTISKTHQYTIYTQKYSYKPINIIGIGNGNGNGK